VIDVGEDAVVEVGVGRVGHDVPGTGTSAGPRLQQYEARLAKCELAVRRGDEDAGALIEEALALALEGGHAVTAVRLEKLRGLDS
jgi:hypothetical protein